MVLGCLHFQLYLLGRPFTVITDHKPSSSPPPRIERWLLKLQNFNFSGTYKAGVGNPADYFSRHPVPTHESDDTDATELAEAHVHFIVNHDVSRAMTLQEIHTATRSDPCLERVIPAART